MSLPRPVRMKTRHDFEAVRLHGESVGGRLLAIGRLVRTDATRVQIGVIVPKALGSAPVRNRLKRRLREIIRHALPVIEAGNPAPVSLVTIARRGSVPVGFCDLHAEWHRLARKLGVWPRDTPSPATPATVVPPTHRRVP
jgi:ribonuclease P protein component